MRKKEVITHFCNNYLAINDYMLSNENFDYRAYIILLDSGSRKDMYGIDNPSSDLCTKISDIRKNKNKYVKIMGIKYSEFNSMMRNFMNNMIKDYKAEMLIIENLEGIKKIFKFLSKSELENENNIKILVNINETIVDALKYSNEELKVLFAIKRIEYYEGKIEKINFLKVLKVLDLKETKENIIKVEKIFENIKKHI